ncbi:MAG: MATE family efflux transporter [Candidatus Cryptobacteroides sp.]
MITQAGQVVVQLADNIMVGHVGTAQLAGVSFANAILVIGIVSLIGFSQGLTPLVGESMGRNDHLAASRYLKNSFVLNTLVFTLMMGILFITGLLMGRMGQEPEVLLYARDYYYINLISVVAMLPFFTCRFFAEGVGNTKYAMWITVVSNLMNILLNWVLIFGHWGSPALGVTGAAIATLVSRIFCAVSFIIILSISSKMGPFLREALGIRPDRQTLRTLMHLSLPISLSGLLESMSFSLAAIMVGWMGKVELAAHQIVQNLSQLSFMVATGIGAAATIRVSFQYGAGKKEETVMAANASIHMSLFYMGFSGLLFIALRHLLPSAYSNDPAVTSLASKLIVVLALFQVADAVQLASMASLRGLKDTKVPMIYSLISYYLVAIPSGYLLGFTAGMGPAGVWVGLLLGLFVAAIFFYVRFMRICRRKGLLPARH